MYYRIFSELEWKNYRPFGKDYKDPWGLSGAWEGGMHGVLFQFPVGVPWRRVCAPMESDRRQFYLNKNFFSCSVTALKRVLEEHRNVSNNLKFIYVNGGG